MKLSRHWTKDKIINESFKAYAELKVRTDESELLRDLERKEFSVFREKSFSSGMELRAKVDELENDLERAIGAGSLRSHECQVLRNMLVMLYNGREA